MNVTLETDFYKLLNTYEIDDLQDILHKTGIIINRCPDGRVHFEVNLFDTSYKQYKVRYQSRGLVLDTIEKKFLAIPPPAFKYLDRIKESEVRNHYDNKKYRIVEANDGTNITIYKFNGETYASSSKSADISNYYWEGNKTFSQMLFEVASRSNPQFLQDTNLKLTDRGILSWNIPEKYSVTIGFRHHNIHPDKSDPEKIWLVKCINRETLIDESIPELKSLERNKDVTSDFNTLDEILSKADRDVVLNHQDKVYGYILQSLDSDIDSVFIPSSLYKLYQHFFYSVQRNKDDELKHNDRYIYSVMRNVLSDHTNYINTLSRLIPEYGQLVDKINIFIDTLISRIIAKIHDNTIFNENIYTDFINKIIQEVKANESDLDIKSPEATKLINDYVKSIDNTYQLTHIYLKE